jgi:hypothetical protein
MYRFSAAVAAGVAALALAAPAHASHGGGTPTPTPTPAGTPAVALSPSTVSYAPQEVGTISAPQTVTLTNTGTASLFINGMSQQGIDFGEVDDQCVGTFVAAGASCTISVDFRPQTTGTRVATISVIDNAPDSPQVITFTGTATSPDGPTPMTIDTNFLTCANGVCALATSSIVNNFFNYAFAVDGETTAPITWDLTGGALPPGETFSADGSIIGSPTTTGTFTFTLRATDAAGRSATQAFSQTVSPVPAPGDPRCQHAPSNQSASLTGAGSGTVNVDQSKFTACGGYVVINVSVKNVNRPNGTVLWVTLSGRPIGTIALSNGAGSIKPYIYPGSLRKLAILVYDQAPPFGVLVQPILRSGSLS